MRMCGLLKTGVEGALPVMEGRVDCGWGSVEPRGDEI